MKMRLITSCLTVLLLTGCVAKVIDDGVEENPVDNELTEQIDEVENAQQKVLTADPAKFHFVADWLTDTEIVYVEKNEGFYNVNSFDLTTGKVTTLYEEQSIIVDVLIHPSKKFLLLHTSDNSTSATIKILSTDGILQNEVEVSSTELEIEWNDLDSTLLILTAFYEDWTFDLFLFEGAESELSLLPIDDPFPKWFGKEQIIIGNIEDHALDGSELSLFNPKTKEWTDLATQGIIYFDTYEQSLLTVTMSASGDAQYKLSDLDGAVQSEWTLPAVSNYSEWVVPEVNWSSNETVFLRAPEIGGQLDELSSPFRLIRVKDGQQQVVSEDVATGFLRCSASGATCITDSSATTITNVETGEQRIWLDLIN
ncbi:YqgU-like beta propeller domain-containing protein [Sporosarcina beigongshangi]|uniref:YqgU-like beta propeller domain-containing protein n=1 Tax=Sporosarcina beigongshangi TaxID=2782538 RepID=UPI00193A6013|nr:hypothetical protein [Sporosarcina beigongshangi]